MSIVFEVRPRIVCGQQKEADSSVYSRKLFYFLMNYRGPGGLNVSVAGGAGQIIITLVLAPRSFLF